MKQVWWMACTLAALGVAGGEVQAADAAASAAAASAPQAAASRPLQANFPWVDQRKELVQPGPQKKPPPVPWNEPGSAPLASIPLPSRTQPAR
jgi:hypothetical protein